MQDKAGEWCGYSKVDASYFLREVGYSREINEGARLSPLEDELRRILSEENVNVLGELAGYHAGEHRIGDARCLVTRGPRILKPVRGQWPTVRKFFEQLFGDWVSFFYGWMRTARISLATGPPWRPGQTLVLAGPAGCGKNLCQWIITQCLGAREAKPYRYMVSGTEFNKELFGAEHLIIQDEAPLNDLKSRRVFGARIKDFTVNSLHSYHTKGKDAICLTPFWRLSISLNEETENLQILPPLDASIKDKLMLFRCSKAHLDFPADDHNGFKFWQDKIVKELPAFLFWLKHWQIPADMQDQRFGVKAYHAADLVEEIDSLSPELKLWSLILTAEMLPSEGTRWMGTAAQLEAKLRERYRGGEAERLFSWNNACGVYLSRLVSKFPKRVSRGAGQSHKAQWVIELSDVET